MKTIEPVLTRNHPFGQGIQKIYRFKNNYGASTVRFTLPLFHKNTKSYGSYTNNDDEWELAIIHFLDDEDNNNYKIDYNTGITDDVIGYLKDKDVQKILRQIQKLPEWLGEEVK